MFMLSLLMKESTNMNLCLNFGHKQFQAVVEEVVPTLLASGGPRLCGLLYKQSKANAKARQRTRVRRIKRAKSRRKGRH